MDPQKAVSTKVTGLRQPEGGQGKKSSSCRKEEKPPVELQPGKGVLNIQSGGGKSTKVTKGERGTR